MSSQTAPRIDLTPLVAPVASYRLYNPADREVSRDFGAKSFHFPPAHEDRGWGPGVLAIGDIRVRGLEDSKGRAAMDMLPALKVVQYFCGDDGRSGKLGEIGIRPLTGKPEIDQHIIAEAREVYTESEYQRCLTLKNAHMNRIAKEKEAGQPITPPDRTIREAMQYVARVELERGVSGMIVCNLCGWGLATDADLTAHIAGIHPEAAQSGQSFEEAPAPARAASSQAAATIKTEAVVEARPRPRPRG